MTFEEQQNDQTGRDENEQSELYSENPTQVKSTDDVLMDYQQLAETKGVAGTGRHNGPHIALNGGQSKDDDRGLDISQYAGPESVTSSQIKDPEAPYGTGPGNGLNDTPQEMKVTH